MLRTALKVGAGLAPRRVANGGAAAGGGRRVFSSLQEALVNVTFVDAEVREVTYSTWYHGCTDVHAMRVEPGACACTAACTGHLWVWPACS